jgi:hypothetical protein
MNSARLIRPPLSSAGKKGRAGRAKHVPDSTLKHPQLRAALITISSPQAAICEAAAAKRPGRWAGRLMFSLTIKQFDASSVWPERAAIGQCLRHFRGYTVSRKGQTTGSLLLPARTVTIH